MDSVRDHFERFDSSTPLHHAYLIEGDKTKVLPRLYAFFDRLKIARDNNPDYYEELHTTFSIDDSRLLKKSGSEKSTEGGKKIFVISAEHFTNEAQQALLKTLEDPSEGTHFFLIVPRREIFLPTVLSRVHIIADSATEKNPSGAASAKAFLAHSIAERLALVTKLIAQYKNAEDGEDVKIAARELINDLEVDLAKKLKNGEGIEGKLREINLARSYLGDRGGSVKMILEHLALIL